MREGGKLQRWKGGKVEGRRQKNTNLVRWKNGKVERLKGEGEKVSRWKRGKLERCEGGTLRSWENVESWEGGTVGGKV
jgi:hypothetical protein